MASTVAPGGDVAPVADSEAVRAAQPVLEAPTDDHTHTTARILADCAMALERQTGWACCCYVEAWSHTNGSVEITYHVWIGRPTGGISTKGTTLTEAVDAALLQWRQATGKDVQP
jgi:hypothetical protein